MQEIHRKRPERTCTKEYTNYRSFKPYLQGDFTSRCGYCDDDDEFFGGKRGFQIDHFHPHSKGGHKTLYANLVYSCPICNRSKSDHWCTEGRFIDPCDSRYTEKIFRSNDGNILHDGSIEGEYIHRKLSLGLLRHKVIWQMKKLESLKETLNDVIVEDCPFELPLLKFYRLLDIEYSRLRAQLLTDCS